MCAVLDGDVTVATVRIAGDVPALFVADAVARLDLAARTLGWRVRVDDPKLELQRLLVLVGLRQEPER